MKKDAAKQGISLKKGIPIINERVAGIDVGASEHFVAVSTDQGYEVTKYEAFTGDLKRLVNDLKQKKITSAALEATGVYWLNLYLLLEKNGIVPWLVNAKHVKNVTGRKKDDTDAIWIQKLHACGLLQKAFQPDNETRTLRTYVRQRKKLTERGADAANRMQKALELMNIKVQNVISDILGKTGMEIIAAILRGEREPEQLIRYKDPRIKATDEQILKSLDAVWTEESIFTLRQSYAEYLFYQEQLTECDKRISEQLLKQVAVTKDGDITAIEEPQITFKKKVRKNAYRFPIREYFRAILEVDLTKLPCVDEITVADIIGETGADMSKWPSAKHFASWLNLTPNNKISGGKIISSKVPVRKNYAGQALKMAASSLSRSKTPLGDEFRRIRARAGGKAATLHMAHKLARIIYTMVKDKKEYDAHLVIRDQENIRLQKIKRLEKQLQKLKTAA